VPWIVLPSFDEFHMIVNGLGNVLETFQERCMVVLLAHRDTPNPASAA